LLSFSKEFFAFMQPELLCETSLSLYHTHPKVRLSETISSGDEDNFFFRFPSLKKQKASKLISRSSVNLQIFYGHPDGGGVWTPRWRKGEFPECSFNLT